MLSCVQMFVLLQSYINENLIFQNWPSISYIQRHVAIIQLSDFTTIMVNQSS